jgi:hypothetical protein
MKNSHGHLAFINTGFQAGVVGERSTLAVLTAFHLLAARLMPKAGRPFALPVTRAQPLQGEARDFARILQIEFVFDVRPVGLHRFGTEI